MAGPRVIILGANGRLNTVRQNSLLVVSKAGGVWSTTKASPSLTLVGSNLVAVDAGWYRIEKNGVTPDLVNLAVSGTYALSGSNGSVYNATGPWP